MDKRTVALGVAAAAAVAAAASVTLIGRSSSPKHNEIAAYITSVDQVQAEMQAQVTKTVAAYADFSNGHTSAKALTPQLEQAEQTLRVLRHRLVVLSAPPPAKHLRVLLIRLTGYEVATAHEIAGLSRFSVPFATLLEQAKVAGTLLSRALAVIKPPQPHTIHGTRKQVQAARAAFTAAASGAAVQQADAVDAYDGRIAAVEQRLRRLDPPAIMRPSYRTQLQTLDVSRTAGSALAQALRKKDRSRVPIYGRRFSDASRVASSVSAQEAEIAAVKAYNSRVRAIGTVQGEIRRELLRLQALTG